MLRRKRSLRIVSCLGLRARHHVVSSSRQLRVSVLSFSINLRPRHERVQRNQRPAARLWVESYFRRGLTSVAVLLHWRHRKSAQIPLYVWLPDAMAGPTPVSLYPCGDEVLRRLHDVRCSTIYTHAPTAMFIVAIIGAATLSSRYNRPRPKRHQKVLAYSTISQLGYISGLRSRRITAASFRHHARILPSASLLGSGSVIHGMHHEQDIRRMAAQKVHAHHVCDDC